MDFPSEIKRIEEEMESIEEMISEDEYLSKEEINKFRKAYKIIKELCFEYFPE